MGSRAYWRSFACGRFGCVGGARDFFWLTLLLSLVISMALLLVGSRAGLLDRFTDAILGTMRPHGVPVWVTAHWENHEGIQTNLLERLKELERRVPGESFGIKVYPYRRLAENSPHIRLPVEGAWDSGVSWVGWAVYPNDPLWNLEASKDWKNEKTQGDWLGLPLTIVLSESLFAKQFDYAAYREAMQPLLRKKKLRRLPAILPQGDMKNVLNTLWLKVTVGNREDFVPFRVRWIHHIPGMEKVSYLFPLTTYNALLAAYHFPELRYDPANHGKGDAKLFQLLVDNSFPKSSIAAYARCVHHAVMATGLIDLPKIREDVCPKPKLSDIAKVMGQQPEGLWDTLNHDSENRLWISCHRLPNGSALRNSLCSDDENKGAHKGDHLMFVPWDVTDYGTSFAAVHAYVPDPTHLSRGIGGLLALRTPEGQRALSVQSMYQDALNRFNLLSDLLTTMVPAYALTFGLFLASLLLAQVGTLIGHRRHHYGILLSRGFTWIGIYSKLILQMILATLTGSVVAIFAFIPLLRLLLEDGFKSIVVNYRDLLPPGYNFEVLPLPWQPIAMTVGEVFIAIVCVTLFLTFRLPLRGNTAPSDLLHGDGRAPRAGRRSAF